MTVQTAIAAARNNRPIGRASRDGDGGEEGFLDKPNEFRPDAHYLRSRRARGFAKTATSTSLPVEFEPMTLIFIVSFFGE